MTLQFICPNCKRILKIRPAFVGKTGRCNHCSERIALIGDPNDRGPQMATRAGGVLEDEQGQPVTPELCRQLERLGIREERIAKMDLAEARQCAEDLERKRRSAQPATEKQLEYLRKLGARESQIDAVLSREEASRLIEDLHVNPTPRQIHYLRELGASGADMARLRTKAEAAAFIEDLQRKLNV